MSRPPQRNVGPVPTIIVTPDDDDVNVNDGEDPRCTQLDVRVPKPYELDLDPILGPHGPPNIKSGPNMFWNASIPIRSPSITSSTAATHGDDALFSPLLSISSRSSLDDGPSFTISNKALCELLTERKLSLLQSYGGIDGIARHLESNLTRGLHCNVGLDATRRRAVFGSNLIPDRTPKTLWVCTQESLRGNRFAWVFLLINSFSMALSYLKGETWIEGTPGILVLVSSIASDTVMAWKLDRKFACTLKRTTDAQVKIVRGESTQRVPIQDIMVGDVICLEQGDLVPADGILISGRNIQCVEACLTGEPELVAKAEAPREGEWEARYSESLPDTGHCDPFILSGSRIVEGAAARYLVTNVGVNSTYGRVMQQVRTPAMDEQTPLQQRVGSLTGLLSKLAYGIVGLFLLIILYRTYPMALNEFLMDLQMAVTMVLVSVPEGLPMSVTAALISAQRRVMHLNKVFVSKLSSCEIMGNATTICCDKTGTMTMNEMEVATGTIGINGQFSEETGNFHVTGSRPLAFQGQELEICPKVRDLFVRSAAINSTASESEQNSIPTYDGSGTETALLRFARSRFGLGSLREERERTRVVKSFRFDSRTKCMATVTKVSDTLYRMYVKGTHEILLQKSDRTILGTGDLTEIPITEENVLQFTGATAEYGSMSLRVLGLAYRDFPSWPPPGLETGAGSDAKPTLNDVLQDLVFFGVVGIHDPIRPGVRDTVATCQGAGIAVRLVTGDSKVTAVAVARACGILGTGDETGLVMEGQEFRDLSPEEMRRVLPRLRVLARSIPEDKKLMVTKLQELGDTVAVIGDGTNDGPALRAADVGIALGKSGTEIAKEASSIVLLDDDFSSIVQVIALGRSVYDAVRRFLQFQLTANLSVLALSATFALRDGIQGQIFTVPEMLWINVIMDLFAALALSTDGPDRQILNRPPEKRSKCLLTFANYKMIIFQAAYQFLVVLFIMSSRRDLVEWLGSSPAQHFEEPEKEAKASWLRTLAANTYVFMLLFNLFKYGLPSFSGWGHLQWCHVFANTIDRLVYFSCRPPDNKGHIFKGANKNKWFVGIAVCSVSIQVLWISFGGEWLQVTKLSSASWAFSVGAGFLTIPLGMAIRCFPDERILAPAEYLASKAAGRFGTVRRLRVSSSGLGLAAAKEVLAQLCFGLLQLAIKIEIRRLALAGRIKFSISKLMTSLHFPPRLRAMIKMDAEDILDERTSLLGHENV